MMPCKKIIPALFLLGLVTLYSAPPARASHAGGAELIYEHLSGSTYRFYYKFYRDCGGIPEPELIPLCYRNECNVTDYYAELQKVGQLPDGRPNGAPVNPGCPDYPTTCNGGTLKGYREWWYYVDVTLPFGCNKWTFSTSIYARNPSDNITDLPTQSFNLYVEATLNNLNAASNSSPYFSVKPVPYLCANVPYAYNNGAVDPDGDSLSFDLVQPQSSIQFCPEWVSHYFLPFVSSAYNLTNNPVSTGNTFSIDPRTGQMFYTPNMLQRGTITVRVREYRDGMLIGSVMRDIQITVVSCSNPAPAFGLDSTGITGGGYIDGMVQTCVGNTLDFCFELKGQSHPSVLVVTDNASLSLPGSTVSYTGMLGDSVRGCVSWRPQIKDTGFHVLAIVVLDSICKPPGMLVRYVYSIPVRVGITGITEITGRQELCLGDSTRLTATGGTAFNWSVLSGDAGSLSCTGCSQPWVKPDQHTTYAVKSNLQGYCTKNSDTFTVMVHPGPVIDPGPDLVKCAGDTLRLNQRMSGTLVDYDITWLPQAYLDSNMVLMPRAWPPVTTTYRMIARLRNGLHCQSEDTVRVEVQGISVTLSDTTICEGVLFVPDGQNATGIPVSYLWDFGDGNTSVRSNPSHQYEKPGTYKVVLMIASNLPCYDTVTAMVHVDSFSFARFTMDRDSLCEGGAVAFYPEYRSGVDQLVWDFGDGTESGTGSSPVHAYDRAGQMIVTLTVKHPYCPDTSSVDTIQIFPYPVVNLGPDTLICPGTAALPLSNLASSGQGFNVWSTGNQSDQIWAEAPGVYYLTVTSGFGCATTDTMHVRRSCYLGIPNVFTPNNDGLNDYFFPRDLMAGGLARFRMQVFNRWGQVIFETAQTEGRGWDGKFNGADQPQGVYAYLIEVSYTNETSERHQGNVSLMR